MEYRAPKDQRAIRKQETLTAKIALIRAIAIVAQPAECEHTKTHYSSRDGGAHLCSDCGESQQGGSAQPADGVKS